MFFIVLRKLINNKWMVACLLLGSIIVVAMISSIPMYTDGILQRMLTKDLESYQLERGSYPGKYYFKLNCMSNYRTNSNSSYDTYKFMRSNIWEAVPRELNTPLITKVEKLKIDNIVVLPEVQREKNPSKMYLDLIAYSDYLDHISVTQGRLPSGQIRDGVIEVLINESVQKKYNIYLNEVYLAEDFYTRADAKLQFRIMPVGFFSYKEASDPWWYERSFATNNVLLMDYGLFGDFFIEENKMVNTVDWFFGIDYHKITIDRLPGLLDYFNEKDEWCGQYSGFQILVASRSIMEGYFLREKQLRLTLWVLQAPILIMLAFYIFMVSQLIIENERNEIAVMNSRGASRFQIFASYIMQSLLLSGIAVIAGPFLAMLMCRVLGASNGFLELVSRTALPIVMRFRSVAYAAIAGLFSVFMMMIPALGASKVSIVVYKQKKARKWNAPLWQKMFLDVILIALALYGFKSFQDRQMTLILTSAEALKVPIDPLLFLIFTLFVLGVGLLFLRIYPYVVRLIYWAGSRIWPPVLYASFIQVGRSGGREQFLMLFIILTMSIGVFSANSARTVNQNIEDRISYEVGADISMQMVWPNNEPPSDIYTPGDMMGGGSGSSGFTNPVIIYEEPDFDIISRIKGIEAAAKVLMPQNVRFRLSSSNNKVGTLMAIDSAEFGEAVWSTPELLPYHINEYLNLLTYAPNAVIVSSAFRDNDGLQLGDTIEYFWENQTRIEGAIAAFADYWPGINPHLADSEYFVVANLSYAQAKTMLEPYQIWMRKEPGATSKTVYDDIKAKGIDLVWLKDASQDMVDRKNDPLLQGTNGALTMGFIITMLVSMLGFIIYWILSIQSRKLQFGIFRAMGLSQGRVMGILLCEQVLISLTAILAGIIIGGIASDIFVPLLQMIYSSEEQVPPFRVVMSRGDYLKIYAMIGIMLASGFAILGALISRIKMAQAIKLGEE